MNVSRIATIEDMRRRARRSVPRVVFDYIDGGAEDEITMRANHDAFDRVFLRQRMPTTTAPPDLSTDVLGRRVSLPVVLAPCGFVTIMYPDGAVAAADAAAASGTFSVLSTVAGSALEDVAARSNGAKWFQLYSTSGRDEAAALIERAQRASYEALVVTVDTAALGSRERDARNGITLPVQVTPAVAARMAVQLAARPAWLARIARHQLTDRSAREHVESEVPPSPAIPKMAASPFTFEDLAWIRQQWRGPLIVKGIGTPDDARGAQQAGADAVVVSNHGGRQLEGALPTLDMLPPVVDAVGSEIEVLLDGGVRRGRDVVKAVALGARAVLIGRAYLYGLAVAGRAGVERSIEILRSEMTRTMTLMACASTAELDRDAIATSVL